MRVSSRPLSPSKPSPLAHPAPGFWRDPSVALSNMSPIRIAHIAPPGVLGPTDRPFFYILQRLFIHVPSRKMPASRFSHWFLSHYLAISPSQRTTYRHLLLRASICESASPIVDLPARMSPRSLQHGMAAGINGVIAQGVIATTIRLSYVSYLNGRC